MTASKKDPLINLDKEFSLKKDFPVPSYEEWLEEITPFLKGSSFEKKLCTPTYEGFSLNPLYIRSHRKEILTDMYPGMEHELRGKTPEGYIENPWVVSQELSFALPEVFNKALLHDLQRGQTGVQLKLDIATRLGLDADEAKTEDVGAEGLSISDLQGLETALKGVDLSAITLQIDGGFSALPFLTLFNAYLEKQGIDGSSIRGVITQDPFDFLARYGFLPMDFSTLFQEIAEGITWLTNNTPHLKGLGISTLAYHNGGASAVQELAWMLSTLLEWITQLEEKKISPEITIQNLQVTLGVGPFFFMEIAKFRAARLLVKKVLKEYNLERRAATITWHARPSLWNQTLYDPYVNMLRTTTEALSAILGGVDSLHTNRFDEIAVEEPTLFSRRIARNIQLILCEESHLDRIIDPAGGSYFIESLTWQLAKESWKYFQETERQGGLLKALSSGWIFQEVMAVREAREKDIRKRKKGIVGINVYADIKQKKLQYHPVNHEEIQQKRSAALKAYRHAQKEKNNLHVTHLLNMLREKDALHISTGTQAMLTGATLGDIAKNLRYTAENPIRISPIPLFRASSMFEHFRDRGWEAEESPEGRPKILLVTMGSPSQHKIRADFCRGFLEPGGFDILTTPNQSSPEEAAITASKSGCFVAVLCSTDETYPEIVPPFIEKLQALKSPLKVIVAGKPKESLDLLERAGVYRFLYLGADAVDVYEDLWKIAKGDKNA
ncbi:MAG: methylmalonyl-CoA mutase family protein [Candidatus Marinimicrobia bacterium]|nr:methylmalonyl-CoA mutase family protein [Candidatus Neomarinimicrobiota bacterium]MDD5581672.1 methylmalonyl-CoA mutase family protein [Candidatus Neomarinimicrobiota bacterium]